MLFRSVQDTDGIYSSRVAIPADQDGALDLADLRTALGKLPEEQREVLIMVGATGLSYEEAADICGVAVGTVKSRVNRGRNRLAELLGIQRSDAEATTASKAPPNQSSSPATLVP